jgi:hypothetical protein
MIDPACIEKHCPEKHSDKIVIMAHRKNQKGRE